MGGRIDCYIDIGEVLFPPPPIFMQQLTATSHLAASLYSYIGFVHLVDNLATLESHGVQVE